MCYSAQEPSAVLWWAVASDEQNYCGRYWLDSQIIIFNEMTWDKGSTPEKMANQIKQFEKSMDWGICGSGPAGSAGDVPLWNDDGNPAPIQTFGRYGVTFGRANEDEPSGWALMRSRFFTGDLIVSSKCETLLEQIKFTTANPQKKEYAEEGQQIAALTALRFICNAYKRKPNKESPTKIDVATSYRTILGGRNATL